MTNYSTREIPPELGSSLLRARGLPRRPLTLGELTEALDLAKALSADATAVDASALCCSGPSRHQIMVGESTRFTHCVLDALMLPVIENTAAIVRSTSPATGSIVELQVSPYRVESNPPDAVVSFGMLRESEGTVYETTCPYINIFPSISEYELWAAASPEVVTIALPVAEALEFARALVLR